MTEVSANEVFVHFLCASWLTRSLFPVCFLPTVNEHSPYAESAGVNPADATASIQGPLHDYGSYITSCE